MPRIRRIIEGCENGYLLPEKIHELFDAASIPFVREITVTSSEEALSAAKKIGFPVVMKVVGPIHKTEVGGVSLNVRSSESVLLEFERMMQIEETTAVIIAEQSEGIELFLGAQYEPKFGHIILCGIGGIFVEVLKDVTSGLAPLTFGRPIR